MGLMLERGRNVDARYRLAVTSVVGVNDGQESAVKATTLDVLTPHPLVRMLDTAFKDWEGKIAGSESGALEEKDVRTLLLTRNSLDLRRLRVLQRRISGERTMVGGTIEEVLPTNRGQLVSARVHSVDGRQASFDYDYSKTGDTETVTISDGNRRAIFVSTNEDLKITLSRNRPEEGAPSFFGRVTLKN